MRIAYMMSRFPKLTETFVLNEIRAMDALGADVAIYPLQRERQRVVHPEAVTWAHRAHFRPFLSPAIVRAQLHYLRRGPAAYLRVLTDVLQATWGSPRMFMAAVAFFPKAVRMAYEMRLRSIAHIHAHFATHPAMAAYVIHRLTGIPYSFTAHGSDLHVDRRMLPQKVAAAAFTVTISDYNREVIIRECGEAVRDKVHVIHCGIDPELFKPARAPRDSAQPGRLICVASFEDVKGHRFLLDACRLLRDRGVDFRCDLIGDGPLRRTTEERIRDLELAGHVLIHGPQTRQVVIRMLAQADVAVLASHPTSDGRREGIPVALMEAMASGLPVVSTAISGIPELVASGESGLLVPPRDPEALADALETLLRDGALRRQMGEAARARVMRDFNLAESARTLHRLFTARTQRFGTLAGAAPPPRATVG